MFSLAKGRTRVNRRRVVDEAISVASSESVAQDDSADDAVEQERREPTRGGDDLGSYARIFW